MKTLRTFRLVCLLAPLSSLALAQTPSITAGGVVNAASFAAGQAIAAGSLVSIFGTNLAPSTQAAQSIPLPTSMNGVSVTFNGVAAPLHFVAQRQINAQVPWEVLPAGTQSGTASVVVTVNGVASAPLSVPVGPVSPGIFTVEFGVGKAIVINQDGSLAQPSGSISGVATHPAMPGDILAILGTGLGAVTPPAVTGNNSLDTLRTNTTTPTVLIGGVQAQVQFSGLSPQFVGVNQINVVVPAGAPSGSAVSLQIQEGGITTTPLVTMAVTGGTGGQVPSTYQDLYTQLQNYLNTFSTTLQWNGQKTGTLFSADVYPAYSGSAGILNPGYYDAAVTPYLNSLQALGVKAVKVAIGFPILYQPFHTTYQTNNPNAYQQYLSFYQRLVADVHNRGMKFIAHCQIVHTGGAINILPYYNSLTWTQYIAGRSAQIQTVAQQLKPDYIAIQTEPDTEATNSGKSQVYTTAGYQQLLSTILSDLRTAGLHTMPITAGIGTWIPNWQAMTEVLTGLSDLDMVDLHIYPINTVGGTNYLNVAMQVADMAHAAGKKVSMTECWLYKVRDSELSQGFTSNQIYSRDVYSFWAPLDQQFLQLMAELGWAKQLEFVSPYAARYFNAYLDYNQVTASGCGTDHHTCTAADLDSLANQALSQALQGPQFTSTGLYYQNLIK